MCSVSWWIDASGYQLFFNRDEQKSRAPALPPQTFILRGVKVLMPVDPVGQGSWISVNEHGLSLCLLNHYQGKKPAGELISRGQLVKYLSSAKTIAEVAQRFSELKLGVFAPFTLLAFELGHSTARELQWNGESFCVVAAFSPYFSSAVALEDVVTYRQSVYDALPNIDSHTLLAFHAQHHPEQSHMSVCMHRDDAQTVSFTGVRVSEQHRQMSYVAGSPCTHLTAATLALKTSYLEKTESHPSLFV